MRAVRNRIRMHARLAWALPVEFARPGAFGVSVSGPAEWVLSRAPPLDTAEAMVYNNVVIVSAKAIREAVTARHVRMPQPRSDRWRKHEWPPRAKRIAS
jgi:hypothetical protein